MKKLKLSLSPQNSPRQEDTEVVYGDHSHASATTETDLQVTKQGVRQTDPLKIDLVLERIFDYCSVETLKTCRLVSTQWRDHSLKAWRNSALLILVLLTDPTSFDPESFNFTEYQQLLESENSDDNNDAMLRNLKKYPFKQFFFIGTCLSLDLFSNERTQPIVENVRFVRMVNYPNLEGDPGSNRDIDELRKFFKQFQSLEALDFQDCFNIEYNFSYDPNEEDVFGFKLPRMKRLKIQQDWRTTVGVWECILKWFPNLEALSLKYEHYVSWSTCYVNIRCILSYVKRIRQRGGENVLALKELEIHFPETDRTKNNVDHFHARSSDEDIVQTIIECNFPLERLHLSVGWKDIRLLLESCNDTLQYFKTSFHYTDQLYDSPQGYNLYKTESDPASSGDTICLENVKEACLGNGQHHALHLMTHLQLPKLEKLTIEKDESVVKSRILKLSFPKGRAYKSLETLEFLDSYKTPSPNTMDTLIKMMPNLAHLTIPLDKTTFQIVCTKLRVLKTLSILSAQERHEELNDESLTGVALETEERGRTRSPNITDLTLLTDLKISCHSQLLGNDVKFTDHSVIHGFLHLPRLYSLSIAFKNLSEDVRAKLLKHVKGNVEIQEKPTVQDNCILEIGTKQETHSDEAAEVEESCVSECDK